MSDGKTARVDPSWWEKRENKRLWSSSAATMATTILALSRTSGATHDPFLPLPRHGLTVLSAVRSGEYQYICQRTSFVHL